MKVSAHFFCLLFSPLSVFAQYTGGDGGSDDGLEVKSVSLEGTDIGSVFNGGDGSGDVVTRSFLSLAGEDLSVAHRGSDGSGDILATDLAISLNGQDLTPVFGGGDGLGDFSLDNINVSLNGQDLDVPFFGANGDGDTFTDRFSVDLNGNSVGPPFFGGQGNGDDLLTLFSQSLNGQNLSVSFFGSTGNGDFQLVVLHRSLSGADLSFPFIGGDDDGSEVFTQLHSSLNTEDLGVSFLGSDGNGMTMLTLLSSTLNGIDLGVVFFGGNGVGEGVFELDNAVLPIKLFLFIGEALNDRIILRWKTASEIGNDFFTVEKSLDGEVWDPLGTVKGAGNSTDIREYSYIDYEPNNGIQFYRLKQTDFDGSFRYSEIISVSMQNSLTNSIVYPNPSDGEFLIGYDNLATTFNVTIFDLSGKVVFSDQIDSSNPLIDISEFPDDTYVVEIDLNGSKSIHRIIKF